MKNIGLYFGTFNPIHVGHLIIANYMVEWTKLDEVWFVVSPHNPHKEKSSLLADVHRLNMVRVAIEDNFKLKASDIEFGLPRPSYTINTLTHLKERYPDKIFSLIMGGDNLRTLHKWKNYEELINNFTLYVYPRSVSEGEKESEPVVSHSNIVHCQAPLMQISASFIRNAIAVKKDVRYLLSDPVFRYLDEMNFYKS